MDFDTLPDDTQTMNLASKGQLPFDSLTDDEEKYGGLTGELASGALGAARGASFGLSDEALVRSGIVNPKTIRLLKETNPGASIAGEFAGVLGPAAFGDEATLKNLPGLVSKLGKMTEEHALSALPEGSRLSAAIAKGVGFGAEGAAYGLGQSISEDALGDHNLLSEKTLANIGYSAALAGGLGATIGAYIGPSLDSSSGSDKLAVQKMQGSLDPASIEGAIVNTEMPASEKMSFLDAIQSKKKNAREIEDAANELGIKAHPGQLSANKSVQDTYTALAEAPTIPGVVLQNSIKKDFDVIDQTIKDNFGQSHVTPYESGALIKDQIQNKVDEIYKPLSDYYAQREALGKTIDLKDEARLKLYDQLVKDSQEFGAVGSKGSEIMRGYAERALSQNTASQMDELIKEINAAKTAAFRAGDTHAAEALSQTNETLRDFLDRQIAKSGRALAKEGVDEADKEAIGVINEHREATKKYREFKEIINDLVSDQRLGGKKNVTKGAVEDLLSGIPNEKVIDRMFDAKNYDGLKRLQKNFPDVFETVVKQKKSDIIQNAMEDGHVKIKKILNQIYDERKMSKEVRGLLFDENTLKKLDAAKIWMEAWPKHFNPSGTSYGIALREGIKNLPGAALNNLTTFLTKKVLDNYAARGEVGRLMALGNIQREAEKNSKRLVLSVRSVFDGQGKTIAVVAPSRKITTEEDFEKKKEEIRNHATNPNILQEKLFNATAKFSDHIPEITQSAQMALARANAFLASKLPPEPSPGLFNAKSTPSPAEISNFNRYYSVVEDPLYAIEQLKAGTLVPETIETLSNVYPSLYQDMKLKIMDRIAKLKDPSAVPYRTRLGISQFLQNPEFINGMVVNQASYQMPTQPQVPQKKSTKSGPSKLDLAGRVSLSGEEES